MLASLIALSLALLAGPVTIEEAPLTAEERAGRSLELLSEVEVDGDRAIATYTDGIRRYRVDMVTGAYLGWREISPVSGDRRPCNEDEAIALVVEEARRKAPVGDVPFAVDDLAWTVVGRAGDAIVIRGETPKQAIFRQSHFILARVSSTEGRLTSFAIDEPAPSSPLKAAESATVLYGGIVLLCAIALGVFLLRRRRTAGFTS
ncbi:MAG: hypothetical protein KBA64_09330 [Armatimonadetes bacterium]|jgi:hypothetical protein|nr:hypothetical protein [Armatimonadota bacterium]MDI9601605.1 hypothetical protein [Acidobacteriota bacterium]